MEGRYDNNVCFYAWTTWAQNQISSKTSFHDIIRNIIAWKH